MFEKYLDLNKLEMKEVVENSLSLLDKYCQIKAVEISEIQTH